MPTIDEIMAGSGQSTETPYDTGSLPTDCLNLHAPTDHACTIDAANLHGPSESAGTAYVTIEVTPACNETAKDAPQANHR